MCSAHKDSALRAQASLIIQSEVQNGLVDPGKDSGHQVSGLNKNVSTKRKHTSVLLKTEMGREYSEESIKSPHSNYNSSSKKSRDASLLED